MVALGHSALLFGDEAPDDLWRVRTGHDSRTVDRRSDCDLPAILLDDPRPLEPVKISATIITYNEERNIARAIESLRCCDEILIVDSGSTDRTTELAENLGARVIEANWRGYAGQKNWAADQASHDWVLSLDADEALSEGLEAEIWSLKKSGPRHDGYTMPRLARYMGRWILHSGWYPDRKLRLYD